MPPLSRRARPQRQSTLHSVRLWQTCLTTALLLATGLPGGLQAQAQAPVNLRSIEGFVILSGAAISTTGRGLINGDVGASPIAGSAIGVTCAQVVGTIYAVDASGPPCAVIDATLLTTAKGDVTIAYHDAAGRTPIPSGPNLNPGLIPGSGNIGGMTLAPGLYKFTTTAMIAGADLTLSGSADDVWIFQCAQDLQLASGIQVILAGGAQAKNIFWQVGTSAVLGTSSVFKGTIMADQAITIQTSSTLEGRALAFGAGVTYNGTAAGLPTSPEIAVEKPVGVEVVDGGTRDFGAVLVGDSRTLTFTVANTGTADLNLTLPVTVTGADAALFTVTAAPLTPVLPGQTTTFSVRFAPLAEGPRVAALRLLSKDGDEAEFDLNLTGRTATGGLVTTSSPILLNPQTGLFEQTVRFTNVRPVAVAAIRLLIQGLPSDVEVYNASGFAGGIPYLQYNLPITPGAEVLFVIEYYRSSRLPIPLPTIVAETTMPVSPIATGTTFSILRTDFTNGRFLIELVAVPGARYAVQYSPDLATWKTAVPSITASSNRVQWFDDGPPKTESIPISVSNRFYRVVRLP